MDAVVCSSPDHIGDGVTVANTGAVSAGGARDHDSLDACQCPDCDQTEEVPGPADGAQGLENKTDE